MALSPATTGNILRIGVAALGPRHVPKPTGGSVPIPGGPKELPIYYVSGLRDGLTKLGYQEDGLEPAGSPAGRRFALDVVQGDLKTLKIAVDGFVRGGHSIIVAVASTVVDIAKAATLEKPVPVLFPDISDPVGAGFADSLEHPGHNLSGLSPQLTQSTGQRLAYFQKLMGGTLRSVLAIYDPNFAPSKVSAPLLRTKAAELGIQVVERQLTSADRRAGVEAIMGELKAGEVDGIFVLNDTNVISNADIVFDRASALSIPIMGVHDFMAEWGAIGSYPSTPRGDGFDLASYVDRIEHGEQPKTMAIVRQKPHFAVNLARAACLSVSPDMDVVSTADRVIR